MEVKLVIKAGITAMTAVRLEPAEGGETPNTNAAISGHGYQGHLMKLLNVHPYRLWIPELDPIIG